MKANDHIRQEMKKAGVPLWKTALSLGVSEMTLTRWLRVPLTPEKEAKIMEAIEAAAREG